jgi:hypothetical protein
MTNQKILNVPLYSRARGGPGLHSSLGAFAREVKNRQREDLHENFIGKFLKLVRNISEASTTVMKFL